MGKAKAPPAFNFYFIIGKTEQSFPKILICLVSRSDMRHIGARLHCIH